MTYISILMKSMALKTKKMEKVVDAVFAHEKAHHRDDSCPKAYPRAYEKGGKEKGTMCCQYKTDLGDKICNGLKIKCHDPDGCKDSDEVNYGILE
jgi:hypothetical protein